jgi:uncharacterized membrane protein
VANEPIRPSTDDKPMSMAGMVVVGALAVLGAITLLGWVVGALFGFVKFVILAVVVVAAFAWLAGRRLDR